ncbi:hypothetical protein [Anaeromassilibacillus senegalensis]|uniref:hypothetical protein n=1 Tax=Anaeromassilibacillus senegalensis TaxID=1673717 RepID=UPI0006828FD9|nr:hypothetical protein [Anaeromassilibacillus senegalensis]
MQIELKCLTCGNIGTFQMQKLEQGDVICPYCGIQFHPHDMGLAYDLLDRMDACNRRQLHSVRILEAQVNREMGNRSFAYRVLLEDFEQLRRVFLTGNEDTQEKLAALVDRLYLLASRDAGQNETPNIDRLYEGLSIEFKASLKEKNQNAMRLLHREN